MNTNHEYDEERVAQLLSTLRPAPAAWVQAAQELPRARREIDEIAARVEADKEFRAAVNADLEAALEAAGYELHESMLPALRARLASA
jgi:phage shock protein A